MAEGAAASTKEPQVTGCTSDIMSLPPDNCVVNIRFSEIGPVFDELRPRA